MCLHSVTRRGYKKKTNKEGDIEAAEGICYHTLTFYPEMVIHSCTEADFKSIS